MGQWERVVLLGAQRKDSRSGMGQGTCRLSRGCKQRSISRALPVVTMHPAPNARYAETEQRELEAVLARHTHSL